MQMMRSLNIQVFLRDELQQQFDQMGGCITVQEHYCRKCGITMPQHLAREHVCKQKAVPTKPNNPTSNQYANQTPKAIEDSRFILFLRPTFPSQPNPFQPALYKGQAKNFPGQFIDIKFPTTSERTIFQWKKENTIYYPPFIKSFKPEVIKIRTFQEKMLWFRLNIEAMRIPWDQGCERLIVDRSNIVMSSKQGLNKINLRKQLKIEFNDEVVDDAGGLLREWMHLTIKEIFSPQTGLFSQCQTQETAYKFVWDKGMDETYIQQHLQTLGIIIGKALFERISLDCFFSRTIWRQIGSQPILFPDMFSFDQQVTDFVKQMYKSWKSILETSDSDIQNLFLTMSEIRQFGSNQLEEIDLVKNGRNIEVTSRNKNEYIFRLMNLYATESVSIMVRSLLKGVYKVIPQSLLSVFEPHQFQMLLNGPRFINVADWKANTKYKGYKYNDQVIVWFWSVVEKYDQKKLQNLLHYCTGSTRVPILGFKYLESNRNMVNQFMIQKVGLDSQIGNPYPRSYTCFNRLELPEYQSRVQLERCMNVVLEKQFTHFGLG